MAFILFLIENPAPDEMPHYVASDLGLHCFAYDPFTGFQVRMG